MSYIVCFLMQNIIEILDMNDVCQDNDILRIFCEAIIGHYP